MHYLCRHEESAQALYGELGKYLIDISKLVFGGIILAGIMKVDLNQGLLLVGGGISFVILGFAGFAFTLLSKSKK